MGNATQYLQAYRNTLSRALEIAHVSAYMSSRVELPALTCAFSRGDEKRACVRRPVFRYVGKVPGRTNRRTVREPLQNSSYDMSISFSSYFF